jgi:hypothetical protein
MPFPSYSGWQVVLDDPAVAVSRTALDINNPTSGIQIGGTSSGTGPDWGDSQFTQMMAQQGQWGSAPADFIVPNRTITIPLGLGMGGSSNPNANTAFANLREKVGLLQREGGWLKRQRQGQPALYLDVVDAQLTVPDVWGETAGVEPGVTLTLVTLPDWYGDEIALDSISCTGYCATVLTAGGTPATIQGDYNARCRIQVTDRSGNAQNEMYWGVRSRYYSNTATAALVFPVENGATMAGSQFPTVGQFISSSHWGIVGSAGPAPTHVGTYRVLARIMSAAANATFQLTWGLSAYSSATLNTPWKISAANAWYMANLGVVNIPLVPWNPGNGWSASVSEASGGATWWMDYVALVPLESAGWVPNANPGYGNEVQLGTDAIYDVLGGSLPWVLNGGAIGDLPRLPPSGLEARPVQLFVKPLRSDSSYDGSDPGVDAFTVQPYYRPCYMFRP